MPIIWLLKEQVNLIAAFGNYFQYMRKNNLKYMVTAWFCLLARKVLSAVQNCYLAVMFCLCSKQNRRKWETETEVQGGPFVANVEKVSVPGARATNFHRVIYWHIPPHPCPV